MSFKRHSRHKHPERIPVEPDVVEGLAEIKFTECIGKTVTVHVNGYGAGGNGFTGVLLGITGTYLRLLITPSISPACSLGKPCEQRNDSNNIMFCYSCPFNSNRPIGSIAEIPIINIVAFIHNN